MARHTLNRLHLTPAAFALIAAAATPGCLDRPLEPVEPKTTTGVTEVLTTSKVDKIDILLAIDDSGSMGDKQEILAEAVPNLVAELANPACVDNDGKYPPRAGAAGACPGGCAMPGCGCGSAAAKGQTQGKAARPGGCRCGQRAK